MNNKKNCLNKTIYLYNLNIESVNSINIYPKLLDISYIYYPNFLVTCIKNCIVVNFQSNNLLDLDTKQNNYFYMKYLLIPKTITNSITGNQVIENFIKLSIRTEDVSYKLLNSNLLQVSFLLKIYFYINDDYNLSCFSDENSFTAMDVTLKCLK